MEGTKLNEGISNKKIMAVAAAVVALVICLWLGDVHIHRYEPATCMSPARCIRCHKTKGETLEHDFAPATCMEPARCIKCQTTTGELAAHDFAPPTCTEPARCTKCQKTTGSPAKHDFAPATYYSPETCRDCGATRGEKLIPVSEWGFENLEEMEYGLVEIYGYNLGDESGPCVYVDMNGGIRKFENGYMLFESFEIVNGEFAIDTGSTPRRYSVVNNDVLRYGSFTCEIEERKTSSSYENFVVFNCLNSTGLYSRSWYIPYSLIDWDREAEAFVDEGAYKPYKLFLK